MRETERERQTDRQTGQDRAERAKNRVTDRNRKGWRVMDCFDGKADITLLLTT